MLYLATSICCIILALIAGLGIALFKYYFLQQENIKLRLQLKEYEQENNYQHYQNEVNNSKIDIEKKLLNLYERLSVIDKLSGDLSNLNLVFGSKQNRGLFGEKKLHDILQDEFHASQYEVQQPLSNQAKPDFIIKLPSHPQKLALDSKFPYEAYQDILQYLSQNDKIRAENAKKEFMAHMRRHIRDIGEKYIITNETQDLALLFIPAESIYSYIVEQCPDLQAYAAKYKVILCSPNIIMLVIRIIKGLLKDKALQENTKLIQQEIKLICHDISRLAETNFKLKRYFDNLQKYIDLISGITDKIGQTANKITNFDIEESANKNINVTNHEAVTKDRSNIKTLPGITIFNSCS